MVYGKRVPDDPLKDIEPSIQSKMWTELAQLRVEKKELVSKLALAMVMKVPKAIEKDGFLRFIEAKKIVKEVLGESND